MDNLGIGSWIHRRRQKSAGRTALICDGSELRYEELAERIDRLANELAARGVRKGHRVAYLGDNHPAFLETLFAAGVLGAIFVPINTRLAPPEITYLLQHSGADILSALREAPGQGRRACAIRGEEPAHRHREHARSLFGRPGGLGRCRGHRRGEAWKMLSKPDPRTISM